MTALAQSRISIATIWRDAGGAARMIACVWGVWGGGGVCGLFCGRVSDWLD